VQFINDRCFSKPLLTELFEVFVVLRIATCKKCHHIVWADVLAFLKEKMLQHCENSHHYKTTYTASEFHITEFLLVPKQPLAVPALFTVNAYPNDTAERFEAEAVHNPNFWNHFNIKPKNIPHLSA
jgi:hypothetical protein